MGRERHTRRMGASGEPVPVTWSREKPKEPPKGGADHVLRRNSRGVLVSRSTVPYMATFNHGAIEEHFYALDDIHASEVAHEIAARRRLMFDTVQRIERSGGSDDKKTT